LGASAVAPLALGQIRACPVEEGGVWWGGAAEVGRTRRRRQRELVGAAGPDRRWASSLPRLTCASRELGKFNFLP
jgi:hypothetical protein